MDWDSAVALQVEQASALSEAGSSMQIVKAINRNDE
jgi:hypothetical protein